jgi:hypothetical protein
MKRALAALGLGVAGVALLGAITASCGDSTPPEPLGDVGLRDAADAREASRDARPDVLPDQQVEDVWLADSAVPYPGEWKAIPGLPANCPIRVATDPAGSIEPFEWTACTSGRPGCKVFVPKWTGPSNFAFVQSHLGGAFEDSGGVVLSYVRSTAGQPERLSVVQELEGKARAGFFGLSTEALNCQVIKMSATPFGIGGIGYYRTQSQARLFSLVAPPNGMSFDVVELTSALAPRVFTQGMLRGDGLVTLEHNAGGIANYVSALRLSDGQVIPGFPGYTKPALRPIPVPGGYFATADEALYFMPSSGEAARLVATPQAGHEIISVDFDQRGGYAMAWLEMNKTTEVATVYTSPFATTAGALQRRAVAKLPTPYPFVFNAGMLLARGAGHTSFRLVRVADGMGWDIAAEPDHASVDPLWVNDDFVWQWVSGNQPGDPGFPTKNVLLKLPRAPLGAPTVSPGL